VVVDGTHDAPAAAAFLALRRHGLGTVVSLLGAGTTPLPGGRPTARLLARDDDAARRLADGIHDVLARRHGPWALSLAGLPLGDPTAARLAAGLPDSVLANVRSRQLIDGLDRVGSVDRSRDPAVLERWLPALLERVPDPRSRSFLRAAARLHTAIGAVELAVVADGGRLEAGLLTLVDGGDRWPWWGTSRIGGLGEEPGSPLVGLTVAARDWRPAISGRTARR
jgi:hypothetical protein